MTIKDKIIEYIEKINKGYIPRSNDPKEKFSDGTLVNRFWNNYKNQIIEEINSNPKYQVGYEVVKNTINIYKNKINFTTKILEYIEKLNKGYIPKKNDPKEKFSDGTLVNHFWHNYKSQIIEEINSNPKYQVGYEVAKNTINMYLEEHKKRENRHLIKELCLEYSIDINKNKSILNKSYDEVYAKICYLLDNNIPIIVSDKLHGIFFMSDINMQTIYNVSLDNLLNSYIRKDIKKLQLNK